MPRREWKEKQIINFGISFQLRVASTTRKKKNQQRTKAMSLVESAGAARRYAKRFFSIRKEAAAARRRFHLLFHFFKVFCCAKLSCPIDDRTVSIHRQAITRKLWEDHSYRRCEASFAKHFTPNLISVFYCFRVFRSSWWFLLRTFLLSRGTTRYDDKKVLRDDSLAMWVALGEMNFYEKWKWQD